MKNKRIASIVLAMTLVLSTFSTVFATDFDIIEVDGTGRYGFTKWTIDSKLFPKITISPQKYFIEYGEENYELDKVMEKMNDGKSFEDAIAELEPVEEEDEGELKVVSVSAITQTIAAGEEVDLKFEVNGKEYTKETFDEKYGEEGYTVRFLYNFSGATDDNRAGKVNITEEGTFKYAVQVYLEGKEVNEVEAKDFVDVKVVNADKAVSIEKVVLSNKLDYLMVEEKGVGFKVTEAKNALGEDLDEDSLEALQPTKVVSSDVTVAYVDNANNIEVRKTGKVTFTLTYYEGEDAIEVKLPVEVKEAGVATRVEAENQKVAAGTAVNDLDFKVFDQHGLDITNSPGAYFDRIKNVDGDVVDNLAKKGIYTVEIIPADKEDAIGSFTVTVVDVENVGYDEFFFEDIQKEIVLNVEKVDSGYKVPSKDLNLKGIKEGLEVAADDLTIVTSGDGYYLESSDEEVFTVNYNAGKVTVTLADGLEKATKATVKLTHKEGDLVQELAEIELEVVNTTPQIDNLTLAEGVKTLDVVKIDKVWKIYNIEQLTTNLKDENGDAIELSAAMIAKVEFSSNDGKAIVTIKDIYGGKEFVFDAIEVFEVEGVSVDPEELTLPVGSEGEITATVSPANATYKDVTWTSSDETVATVEDGVVTAVAAGTATITVTTVGGDYTATCVVTVSNVVNATKSIGYDTILEAIEVAEDGDTIQIAAGTYDESIVVPKDDVRSITILGANAETVPTSNELDGTIITGGIYIGTDSGAEIDKEVTVKGITFNGGNGLLLGNIKTATVENNKFLNIEDTFNSSTTSTAAIAVIDPYTGGTIRISNNYIDGVSGLGIYVRGTASSTVIEGNHVEATDHNSIQMAGKSKETNRDVVIKNNELINWDQNRDADGGRAIRINFDPVDASTALTVTGNTFNPGDDTTNRVDPEYVKITGVHTDAVSDLISSLIDQNTWPSETDYGTVILVNTTKQVVQGVLLTAPKTYEIISKAGLMNLDTVLGGADLGEGKAATVNLAADIDLTGETWTPISRMWFTFNGNGHTISNLTTESTRKAGLFGYAGAVTVNDLTLENVTVTGSQAGVFAGSGEGFTANDCFLKGTNIVNFTTTEETWNGIGAITGVLLRGTVNVTIDKDATVTLNRGDMTTVEGCVFVDKLTGHITANEGGTVTNHGTVEIIGTIAYN